MKKILTILAASAMFFAFGEDINNGAGFEDYTSTGEGSFDPGAYEPGSNVYYWYSASSAGNVISNHVAAPALPSGVTVPDYFKDDNTNTNFLYLETEAPLFRTVKTNSHDPATFEGVSITENPIYLDTLVKFTAADSAFTSLEDAADKIAIEYVEHEEESHVDQTTGETVIDSAGFTNFVIRAGYLSSPLSQTNYIVNVPANFNKDAWHRLTVRSFGSIDAAGDVGFVVYLDGEVLEYDTAVDVGPGFTPTGAAAAFYTESLHALFPSAVPYNQTGGQAIAAVAFSGNGSIDDVVFTTTMPEFIRTSSLVRTEITIGTGVTDVTAMVAGTSYEAVETNNTLFVFNLPALTTEFVLNVTADTANGYTFNPATCITASNDVTYVGATITITGGSPSLTVVGKRDNAYYMDGETKVGFATLTEAFASAPANATIKLGYNYSVLEQETTTQQAPVFTIGKNLVLDLNGKTLDGGTSDTRALFKVSNGYMLTIIDTVPGDAGSIVYGGTKGMFDGDISNGDVFIGSDADCGAVFIGPVIGTASDWTGYVSGIVRGKFTSADNTAGNGKFICATAEEDEYQIPYGIDVVDGDSAVSRVGDYWVVEPASVGTYNVTVTPTANAIYAAAYTVGGEEIVPANDVLTVTVGQAITITATPKSGYEYAEQPTGWTLSEGVITKVVDEPCTVAIPAPTAKQSSDDWPTGQDLIDAEGHAAGDLFPGITNALATADAKAVATWAEEQNVAYAAKGSILPEAFLLNCANTQDAIDAAAANFKITAITVDGDTVTVTPADGANYGNGKVVIEGTATLSPISWHEKTTGDHFFRATLVVKPVATP